MTKRNSGRTAYPAGDVLYVGATGLVGGLALPLLLQRAERDGFRVHAPTRRPLSLTHPCLHAIVVDLALPDAMARIGQALDAEGASLNAWVCAIGTTQRAAGSREAFAAVDRDLVLALAALARAHGATQAIVVSSVGAAANASNFYLRIKGEMEAGIADLGFARVDFLQPGLLLGQRSESRPAEALAQHLAPLYNPLLCGSLRRYRAIDAAVVARTMLSLLGAAGPGVHRHRHSEISALSG